MQVAKTKGNGTVYECTQSRLLKTLLIIVRKQSFGVSILDFCIHKFCLNP